jgi:hypothetical protein
MDVNELAYKILRQSVGEEPIKNPNPNASRRGEARAKALSPEQRKTIARKGAAKRWGKKATGKMKTDG